MGISALVTHPVGWMMATTFRGVGADGSPGGRAPGRRPQVSGNATQRSPGRHPPGSSFLGSSSVVWGRLRPRAQATRHERPHHASTTGTRNRTDAGRPSFCSMGPTSAPGAGHPTRTTPPRKHHRHPERQTPVGPASVLWGRLRPRAQATRHEQLHHASTTGTRNRTDAGRPSFCSMGPTSAPNAGPREAIPWGSGPSRRPTGCR